MPAAGDFETWDLIGTNAYGAVYRGVQHSLKRDVAVFELDAALRKEADSSSRFWDEVTQLAQMTDDALVPVYAVDRKQGWIVMELMAGQCGDLLDRPQTPEVAQSVLRQGLSGLRRLHEAGRTHGDVRPRTILIHRTGRIKLSFAVGAAVAGGIPFARRDMKYVAPELVSPALGEYGPSGDLYCLGFSIVELLLGPKFADRFAGIRDTEGDARTAWMRWHADEANVLPSVQELVPGASVELVTTLDRMLKKRPRERIASAAEALKLLADTPLVAIAAAGADGSVRTGGPLLVGAVDKLNDPISRYDVVASASTPAAAAASAKSTRPATVAAAKPVAKKKSNLGAILVGLAFAGIVAFIVLSDGGKKETTTAVVPAAPSATMPSSTVPSPPVPAPTPSATPTAIPAVKPVRPPTVVEVEPLPPAPPPPPPNVAPQIEAIADAVVTLPIDEDLNLPAASFRVRVTDPDDPGGLPRFVLVKPAPDGAKLDERTGLFTFTPPAGSKLQAGKYPVTIEVFDAGETPISTTATFQIVVQPEVK